MKKIFLISIIVIFFFFFNSLVYSQSFNSHAQQNRPFLTADSKGNPRVATESANFAASRSALILQRLAGLKLQACQRVSQNITRRSESLLQRALDIEAIFDSHSTAVENYYTTKMVPAGKTLSDYNTLVSDIQTQKNLVAEALAVTKQDASSFSCTSDNPFGQVQQYRMDMLSVIQSLLNYKKSVVNLIVSVAKLNGGVGTAAGTNATESAKPLFVPNPNSTAGGLQK